MLKGGSVFLSYTSEDAPAARLLCAALRQAGIEVWIDQSELAGGEAWDAKIRQQILSCRLFVALISAATERRTEGYFRREWKLAADRTDDIAEEMPFLLPVVIDGTPPYAALVPARFRGVHWLTVAPEGNLDSFVRRVSDLLAGRSAVANLPVARTPPNHRPLSLQRMGYRWARLLALIGLLATLVLAGYVSFTRDRSPPASPPAAPDVHAIAVLPFNSVDEDGRGDYFSDGLTEEILNALAQNPSLRVAARTSSFVYKNSLLRAEQIGRELHVASLIEGSVRRAGSHLRIIVRLVSIADGYEVWSDHYDAEESDLFALQEKIANSIAAQLMPALAAPLRIKRGTTNREAYDAYLRGRSFQVQPPSAESLSQAITYFHQATQLDPNYAFAWARHAQALTRQFNAGNHDDETDLELARASVDTALRLDPALPEGHLALANILTANWTHLAEAEREVNQAAQAQPNDPDILATQAMIQLNRGRISAAEPFIAQAITVDPQNADVANFAGVVYNAASRYPSALDQFDRAYRISGWPTALISRATVERNQNGDLARTLKTLERVPSAARDDYYWRVRSNFLRASGKREAALAALGNMKQPVLVTQFTFESVSLLRARILESDGQPAAARPFYVEALKEAEAYRAAHPSAARIYAALATIYASLGHEAEAFAASRQCLVLVPPEEAPYPASRIGLRAQAHVEARFHQIDDALALASTEIHSGFWRRNDLLYDNDWWLLRREPRFVALARKAPL